MALYLGNQKVSLRSGQDPTFDYGFDSDGRLVFANKNATEINNFLNYDSSYSEILDLSNLSKMEKVAVNGTADRKMEGLKGLLVSPNAPFTGSSPQINASYTGLSKSALVSLFESVPYNVGYTKVGNPTIVDGVASGFSSGNYVKPASNVPFSRASSWEFVSRFQVEANTTGSHFLADFAAESKGFDIAVTSTALFWELGKAGASNWQYSKTISYTFDPTIFYYVKLLFDGNLYSIWLKTDTTQWTKLDEYASTAGVGTSYYNAFGYSIRFAGRAFNGSIDLNETYIKVNGVPWFTGKPAMTKTCSIVGAMGTADLTQEDKNIILNKGWSLTVQ